MHGALFDQLEQRNPINLSIVELQFGDATTEFVGGCQPECGAGAPLGCQCAGTRKKITEMPWKTYIDVHKQQHLSYVHPDFSMADGNDSHEIIDDDNWDEKIVNAGKMRTQRVQLFQILSQKYPGRFPTNHFAVDETVKRSKFVKGTLIPLPCDSPEEKAMKMDVTLSFKSGRMDLDECRDILLKADRQFAKLLKKNKRAGEPLQVFDLPKMGMSLICLPDPRVDPHDKSVGPELVAKDCMLASMILMAEAGFDLFKIRDILGPVIAVCFPFGRKNLTIVDFFEFYGHYLLMEEPDERTFRDIKVRREVKDEFVRQHKGEAPRTDLFDQSVIWGTTTDLQVRRFRRETSPNPPPSQKKKIFRA